MNIAILGTRGIPNHYGGFEQFAQYLSIGLIMKGHSVTVYNSSNHPYTDSVWENVKIIHCKDPEGLLGTFGQFVYDFNCIMDARKRKFDIILQLGYTSSSVWGWLLPRKYSVITTNMDGLEWKRTKYSKKVQRFLLYAEKLGVKYSDYLIADSVGIQRYLKEKYNKESIYIPYGADTFLNPSEDIISEFDVYPYSFNMLIARLEPENSIEMILEGVVSSGVAHPFLVIGNENTVYGAFLKDKFKSYPSIRFLGPIYDIDKLNNLRYFSNLYFHGHTVGGTNPSLLEAMSSNALICAHDNIFNRSILAGDAFYFRNSVGVSDILQTVSKNNHANKMKENMDKIKNLYSWNIIVDQYLDHFKAIDKNRFGPTSENGVSQPLAKSVI